MSQQSLSSRQSVFDNKRENSYPLIISSLQSMVECIIDYEVYKALNAEDSQHMTLDAVFFDCVVDETFVTDIITTRGNVDTSLQLILENAEGQYDQNAQLVQTIATFNIDNSFLVGTNKLYRYQIVSNMGQSAKVSTKQKFKLAVAICNDKNQVIKLPVFTAPYRLNVFVD